MQLCFFLFDLVLSDILQDMSRIMSQEMYKKHKLERQGNFCFFNPLKFWCYFQCARKLSVCLLDINSLSFICEWKISLISSV